MINVMTAATRTLPLIFSQGPDINIIDYGWMCMIVMLMIGLLRTQVELDDAEKKKNFNLVVFFCVSSTRFEH